MPKAVHYSCEFCLWNWWNPINLPPRHCYNREAPKFHKRAIGGCPKFEPPVEGSEKYARYVFPNGKPPKKKKENTEKESETNEQA